MLVLTCENNFRSLHFFSCPSWVLFVVSGINIQGRCKNEMLSNGTVLIMNRKTTAIVDRSPIDDYAQTDAKDELSLMVMLTISMSAPVHGLTAWGMLAGVQADGHVVILSGP